MADSLQVIQRLPGMDIYDVMWKFLLDTYLNYEFLGMCLFVIVIMEVLKITFFEKKNAVTDKPKVNGDWYPYIVLVLSFLAVILGREMTFVPVRKFIFDLLTTVAVIDLIYTYLGYKIAQWVRGKIEKKLDKDNS